MAREGFVARFLKPFAVAAFLAVVAACGGGGGGEPVRTVTTVTVSSPTSNPKQGDSVQLTAVARDQFGDVVPGMTATWSSSAPAVATVSAAGQVQALTPGAVSITATVDGVAGSVLLTVAAAPTWASVTGGRRMDYELDATGRIKSYELRDEASGRVTHWCTGDLHASWQCRYEEHAPYSFSSATVDAQGRFTAYEYRSQMPSGENASYTYDERGRLVAVGSGRYTDTGNIITTAIKLEYDELGRLKVIRHERRSPRDPPSGNWSRLYTITSTSDVPTTVLMTGEEIFSGAALPSYSIRLTHDGSGRFTGKDVYEILPAGERLTQTLRYGIDAYGYLSGVEWCLEWSVSAPPLVVRESRCPASPPTLSIVYPTGRMPSAPLRAFPAYRAASAFDLLCVIADECVEPARRYLVFL